MNLQPTPSLLSASSSSSLSVSSSDYEVELSSLNCDCDAAASRFVQKSFEYQRSALWVSIVAASCAAACVPLITWQIRTTDRVWRLRHPVRVRNQQWAISILGVGSITSLVFLNSPYGFNDSYRRCLTLRRSCDALAWETIVLREELRMTAEEKGRRTCVDDDVQLMDRVRRRIKEIGEELQSLFPRW